MDSLILTKDEIAELTGFKLQGRQCKWLKEHGWVFEMNANRRPIVGREYARRRLGGLGAVEARPEGARPNFNALTRR